MIRPPRVSTRDIEAKAARKQAAEQHVRDAFKLLVEARRELSLHELSEFIRTDTLGGNHGFINSVGKALVAGSEPR